MFKEYRVASAEIDFGHRHDLALHLATAGTELELRHVFDARSLAPAGFADQVADVERRSAGAAGQSGLVVHALAPLALNAFYRRRGSGHRSYDINSVSRGKPTLFTR